MPKVELIGGNKTLYALEKEINEFIKDKNVINISYTAYMCKYYTYREACILYENTSYPIVSGEAAEQIRESLKIGPSEETERGKRILEEMFEGREQNG